MELSEILGKSQFTIGEQEKAGCMLDLLGKCHARHFASSAAYRHICEVIFDGRNSFDSLSAIPFLPVSAFKNHLLKSIPDQEVFKVLTSSGTTGQGLSKIYLDKETARLQTLALSKIIAHVTGPSRLPMLIVDSKTVLSNRESFSARGAGILGLSVFGKEHTYVLDDKFDLDEEAFERFLEKNNGRPVLIFGFTFMIWQYMYQSRLKKAYDLSKAILIHSGGWKKLVDLSVDNATFRRALEGKFGITAIYNFYGMVEQVGSVFIENSDGFLQCPNFAEIIIRDPKDLAVLPRGEEGLIQVLSPLPLSYPGHSLLTEDLGYIAGEDNASNGWKGKYFKITGRAKKAELRGCSDTFKEK